MRNFWIVLFGLLLFGACSDNVAFTESQVLAGGSWNKDNSIRFKINDLDTIIAHNIYIALRNDNTYPYSNLHLIVEMNYPDGSTMRDTLEYRMADVDGSWLGSGSISTIENKLGYRKNVLFPTKGVYTLTISHAMRENGAVYGIESLPGILDIGVQVEKNLEK